MDDKTIVALFDDPTEAQHVLTELEREGVSGIAVEAIAHDPETGSLGDGIVDTLTGKGVPPDDAHVYAEGVRRGGSLICMTMDDDEVDRISVVLERHDVVDIDQRGLAYRRSGWVDSNETVEPGELPAAAGTGLAAGMPSDRHTGAEQAIPVVEEKVQIDKRPIERGRVRIHTRVIETLVEEQVTRHEETVHAGQRPVDPAREPVGPEAFQEKTIEMTATDEEAVVAKSTRATEEVVVHQNVEERTETVADTVRKTEVEVEKDEASDVDDRARRRSGDKP